MLIEFLDGTSREIADLRGADLRGAYLRDADLTGADLTGADLRGAYLTDANLTDAYLRGANLTDTKGLEQQNILPAGDLIGYKKLANGKIAVLRIPAKAARVNAYGYRKCRAAYARVVSGKGPSQHDATFLYAPGQLVKPRQAFDPDPRVDCSSGIHFFITEQEARDY